MNTALTNKPVDFPHWQMLDDQTITLQWGKASLNLHLNGDIILKTPHSELQLSRHITLTVNNGNIHLNCQE